MPHDDVLTARIRGHLGPRPDLSEAAMFGGVAFLIGGNIAVTASSRGLMVRVGKEAAAAALSRPGVTPVAMSGREMRGWVRVSTDVLASDRALHAWVDQGVAYAASLPVKGS